MRPNNICCIGKDQVGRAVCYVIAFKCPEVRVTVLDENETTSEWDSEVLSVYEPELDRMIKNCRNRNLFFSSDYLNTIKEADMIFLCVKVPVLTLLGRETRKFDFTELEEATKLIAIHSDSDKVIVEKTNVSARAEEKVVSILQSSQANGIRYTVLSNPELITEGSAFMDLVNPEFVVIGCQNKPAGRAGAELLCELYESWIPRNNIIIVNHWSSEIYRLAINAFLAQRLCSINSLAIICEETGADISVLTSIISKDSRIGSKYLSPSLGFGGFQKSILDLINEFRLPEMAQYWQAVLDLNAYQTQRFCEKIRSILTPLENRDITIIGFSYRKRTYDTKFSPAIEVCKYLLNEKCNLRIYDPKVESNKILQDLNLADVGEKDRPVQIFSNPYLACNMSSALIICTDRDEFIKLDYRWLAKWMKVPVVIDGRKCLNGNALKDFGIEYHTIGVSTKELNTTREEQV